MILHTRRLTTVHGPAGFKARQIGPDWILGTVADSLDAEHVRIYGIRHE